MSGLFNLLLVLLWAIGSVLFALYNHGEITVRFPGNLVFPNVPVFVLAFVPMFLGFLLGVASGWSRWTKYRRHLDGLRQQNQTLEEELTNLRNLPLDHDSQL